MPHPHPSSVPAVVMTHGGRFHADDVFSSAFLKLLRPDVQIRRSFQVPPDFDGLVYDIGGGEFDHHQQDAEVRENGVPYAAFGLLWRAFGRQLLERELPADQAEEEACIFDEKFVQPLDEDDNKGTGHSIASLISLFNPVWDEPGADEEACQNDRFDQAVSFAQSILHNKFALSFSIRRAEAVVKEALDKAQDGIVILPRYAPWKATLSESEADFVVYPSQRGGFCAQTVPHYEKNDRDDDPDGKTAQGKGGDRRQDEDRPERETLRFPEDWAGKSAGELPGISGIPTLTFCHNGRFLISAETQEGAVQACHAARERADAQA